MPKHDCTARCTRCNPTRRTILAEISGRLEGLAYAEDERDLKLTPAERAVRDEIERLSRRIFKLAKATGPAYRFLNR